MDCGACRDGQTAFQDRRFQPLTHSSASSIIPESSLAERREAEPSEADPSAEVGKTVAVRAASCSACADQLLTRPLRLFEVEVGGRCGSAGRRRRSARRSDAVLVRSARPAMSSTRAVRAGQPDHLSGVHRERDLLHGHRIAMILWSPRTSSIVCDYTRLREEPRPVPVCHARGGRESSSPAASRDAPIRRLPRPCRLCSAGSPSRSPAGSDSPRSPRCRARP